MSSISFALRAYLKFAFYLIDVKRNDFIAIHHVKMLVED